MFKPLPYIFFLGLLLRASAQAETHGPSDAMAASAAAAAAVETLLCCDDAALAQAPLTALLAKLERGDAL